MLTNFLNLVLSFLQSFTNGIFIIPLGFISLYICFQLFRKMGGRV